MTTDEIDQIERDVAAALPKTYTFILVAVPPGMFVEPTYLSTLQDWEDTAKVLEGVLEKIKETMANGT